MGNTGNSSPYTSDTQAQLEQIQRLLSGVHARTKGAQNEDRRELAGKLTYKRNLPELQKFLNTLLAADIACLMETLPLEQRLLVWDLSRAGGKDILPMVPRPVRKTLIAAISRDELLDATSSLDIRDIARLSSDLPNSVMRELFKSLSIERREQLRLAMSFPKGSVGSLMDFGMTTVRDDITVGVALRYLRRLGQPPGEAGNLFVVDRDNKFIGQLPLYALLTSKPEQEIAPLVTAETLLLKPDDKASQAALAFKRYGLACAPVVNEDGRLLGRLTANSVISYVCTESERSLLKQVGLRKGEDAFATVWKSSRNRWIWLALNLCTAFFVSRVIGLFENSIERLAALAALMPVVSSMAGNSARQTAAIIARHLPQARSAGRVPYLLGKELAIAGLHGMAAGGLAGLLTYMLYGMMLLGLLMSGAVLLSMLLGALAATLLPSLMLRAGKNPSTSFSLVLLSAITDSGGFIIFLGLATLFLVH